MFNLIKVEREIAGRTLSIETGKIARQADGAVIVRYGETVVLVAQSSRRLAPKISISSRSPLTIVKDTARPENFPAASSNAKEDLPPRKHSLQG